MYALFERRFPKLLLGLLVACAVVLGVTPGVALADDAVAYPLWVGGTQVTSENLKGQGWSFDPAARNLTLSGYRYEGTGHGELWEGDGCDDFHHAPIFWGDEKGGLTIVLEGDNSVTVTNGTENAQEDEVHRYYGVFSEGSLTFTGTGDLQANVRATNYGEVGVYAKDDLSIEGGSISTEGGVFGIMSLKGTVTIAEGANKITAKTTEDEGESLYAIAAEGGDVRIDGGTVTASGYRGINAAGNIVINGGVVSAQSNLVGTYLGSIMEPGGIYSEGGTVTVNGGTVTAKGHQFGICGGNFHGGDDEDEEEGQPQEKVADDIVINGGSVTVEGIGNGVDSVAMRAAGSGNITIAGGTVRAAGTGDATRGIDALGTVAIKEGISSVVVTGTTSAFGKDTKVKNDVAGTGWTNVDGTEGKAAIEVSTSGQDLSGYKMAQFPAVAYFATGDGSGWTKGTADGLSFSFERNVDPATTFSHFVSASVDGKEMKRGEDYTAVEGSVIVTLTPAYLDALATGEHTLTATFDDGSADAKFTVAEEVTPSTKKDYPAPTMSNSKGGNFASKTDEITYTVSQKVPDWASSVKTWVDLDPVLQYTVDEGGVTVTCDGEAVAGAVVSIEDQRLTVTIADASSLRGKTINIAYRAMLRSDANLDAYLNSAGTTASVPYQAHTVFDGEEDKAVTSEKEFVKFQVGSSSGSSKQSSGTSAATKSSGTLAKTGDATSFASVAVAIVGALALAAARRRR